MLLDYQPGRGQIHPQALLGDYRGILMSDGYTAWRTLARGNPSWMHRNRHEAPTSPSRGSPAIQLGMS